MTTTLPRPVTAPANLFPTLTPSEFARLAEARRLQVERYRTAFYKREGVLPRDDDPGVSMTWLRVAYEGRDCCIPIKLLAAWAATFNKQAVNTVAPKIALCLAPNGLLTLKRGTSTLRVFTMDTQTNDDGKGVIAAAYTGGRITELPDAVPINRVNGGTALSVAIPEAPEGEADLDTLKAETTAIRRQLAKERAIVKAKKAEREALERLTHASTQAAEAQAVLDSMTLPAAITFARRCLAARRLIRATMANPEVMPPWLTAVPSYQGERWVASTGEGDAYVDGHHEPVTCDTLATWHELVDTLAARRIERDLYKPRMSWPHWLSATERKANPSRGTPIYGPAYEKLVAAHKAALENVSRFVRARYAEYCDACGLPGEAIANVDATWCFLSECRAYSRARLLLATWPQRSDDLQSAHREAVAAREAAEAK